MILKDGTADIEQLKKWSVNDALTNWLYVNHDGKWKKHYGTFESIIWNKNITIPKKSEYLLVKDKLEAEEFEKLNKNNLRIKMSSAMPSIEDKIDMLYNDIENGKFGDLAKTSTFYTTIKNIKDSFS